MKDIISTIDTTLRHDMNVVKDSSNPIIYDVPNQTKLVANYDAQPKVIKETVIEAVIEAMETASSPVEVLVNCFS